MNRRTVLKGGFVLAATAHTAALAPEIAADPLLECIRSYGAGVKEFCRRSEEDDWSALTDETYGPALSRLQNWNLPAPTRESAIAGLRLSLDEETGIKGSEAAERMILATIQYLETLPV